MNAAPITHRGQALTIETVEARYAAFDRVGGVATAIAKAVMSAAIAKTTPVTGQLWERAAEHDTAPTAAGSRLRAVAAITGRGESVAPLLGSTFLASGIICAGAVAA